MSFSRALVVLVAASVGCRYHSTRVAANDGCRRTCADVHESCASQRDLATTFGLPGVKYDRCRRELDDCLDTCRSSPGSYVAAPGPELDDPVPRDGVEWDASHSKVSCAFTATELALPATFKDHVRRIDPDQIVVDLSPAAVLLIRSGNAGQLPSTFDDWVRLQAMLSTTPDARADASGDLRMNDRTAWHSSYTLTDEHATTAYRAAGRQHAMGTAVCRLLAVERVPTTPELSTVPFAR